MRLGTLLLGATIGLVCSHWLEFAASLAQDTIVQTEPASTSAVTFQTLSDDQAAAELHKRQYLEANGWAYNCDNPGSLWLWAKTLNGKEYRLERDTAVAIQIQADTQEN